MTQRLHLVFGGELTDPSQNTFRDVDDDTLRRQARGAASSSVIRGGVGPIGGADADHVSRQSLRHLAPVEQHHRGC